MFTVQHTIGVHVVILTLTYCDAVWLTINVGLYRVIMLILKDLACSMQSSWYHCDSDENDCDTAKAYKGLSLYFRVWQGRWTIAPP